MIALLPRGERLPSLGGEGGGKLTLRVIALNYTRTQLYPNSTIPFNYHTFCIYAVDSRAFR